MCKQIFVISFETKQEFLSHLYLKVTRKVWEMRAYCAVLFLYETFFDCMNILGGSMFVVEFGVNFVVRPTFKIM